MMNRSPEERLMIGFSMLSAAKELILASLPADLSTVQRKRLMYQRLYGHPVPVACSLERRAGEVSGANGANGKQDHAE